MFGFWLIIGILVLSIALAGWLAIRPKIRKYRLILKKVEPRRKARRSKSAKKKRHIRRL